MTVKAREFLYISSLMIYVVVHTLNDSLLNLAQVTKYIDFLLIGVLFISFMLRKKYKIKEFTIYICLLCVFFVSAIKTNQTNVIMYALFILTVNELSFKRILKFFSIGSFLGIMTVFLLCKMGKILDYTIAREYGVAHSLGFTYYSYIPFKLFYIMLSYLYVKGKSITWLEVLIMCGLNCWVYSFSMLRLTFYLNFLILILFVIFVKFDRVNMNSTVVKKASFWSFPIACMGCFLINYYYTPQNRIYNMVNVAVSNRLALGNKALNELGISLIGQYVEMNGNGYGVKYDAYFYLDSGYIFSLVGYGLIFTIIAIAIYMMLGKCACIMNDKALLLCLVGILIFSFVNNTLAKLNYNPFLLGFPMAYQTIKRKTIESNKGKIEKCLSVY